MMPVSEIYTRMAKLKEVKQSIDDSRSNLTIYIERVNELVDWAERECDTLSEQLALRQAEITVNFTQ